MGDSVIVAGQKVTLDEDASMTIAEAMEIINATEFNAESPEAYFAMERDLAAKCPAIFAQYQQAEEGL